MSKKTPKTTMPLFQWLEEQQRRETFGVPKCSLDVDKELKAAIADDIKHAVDERGRELSRAAVAARMTDLTGDEITLSNLNNWTAVSHPHSMPSKYLPAFIIATNQRRAIETISRKCGLFAMPGKEALRAEVQRLDEKEKEIRAEKTKHLTLLKVVVDKE
ncbi:MAG: hypothetical protein HQK99_16980 [Nitrospirae bacterium]|nr:hypothetical protein [Nitrospirota bacterium]